MASGIENGGIVERLILGLVLSALAGGIAFRLGMLDGSGWLGAMLVGTAIFGFGGWPLSLIHI